MAFLAGRRRIWVKVVILLIFVSLAGVYDAPDWWNRTVARGPFAWSRINERPFRLGLDLRGGSHLVYEGDTSRVPDREQRTAMEGVRDVIERRVNALGVAEPVVQLTRVGGSWRLIVELAGVYDTQKAIDVIGATPVLEFREAFTEEPKLTPEQERELKEKNTAARKRAEEALTKARTPEADVAALAREFSEDPSAKSNSGDLGWFKRGAMVKEFEDAAFGAKTTGVIPRLIETQFGWHVIVKVGERDAPAPAVSAVTEGGKPVEVKVSTPEKEVRATHILIRKLTAADLVGVRGGWKYTGLGGKQLKRASLQFDPTSNEAEVALEFSDEGAKLFEDITTRNVNRPIAIFIDDRSPVDTDGDGTITDRDLYAPVVQSVITGGKARITGSLTVESAKVLARRLQAGALPVPIALLSQTTIGATLGEAAVAASLRAALIGFVLIAVFMIVYYRLPGLIATIALAVYGALVLAVLKLLGATLTLAGIAGFVMSLGMAVDANVLIFERLREELHRGRSILDAIGEAFHRAWTAIRDSNLTTLITCAILATFSTSVVKGFAVTLAVGVLMSMCTAITVTRVLLELIGTRVTGGVWYGVRMARAPKNVGTSGHIGPHALKS